MARSSSAIARLLSGLQRAPHVYATPTAIFPDLDVQRLAAELRLQERGTERGKAGEPPCDGEMFDDVELEIVERIDREKRSVNGSYNDQIQTYAERLAGLDFESRIGTIKQAAPQAVGDFRAEAATGRDELFRLRRRIVETEQDREYFRQRHRIRRSARTASAAKQTLKTGILLVLFVAEVAINGSFLAKGNEQGLLGGAVLAVSFAALNVLGSFLLGLSVVRLVGHRRLVLKLVGLGGIAFYILLAAVLNLALAHYREAAGRLLADQGIEVVSRLRTIPFGLIDIESWVLLGVGLTFSLIALADGVMFRDPYVGYSTVEKAWLSAHQRYTDAKATLIENLRDIRDEASTAMGEAARDLSMKRGEFDSILQARARLNTAFVDFQAQLERTAQALLAKYRESNRRSRPGDCVPVRFTRIYAMDRIVVTGETETETARDQLRKSIADSQALLDSETKSINQEFEAAVALYRQIDDMLPETPNGPIKAA